MSTEDKPDGEGRLAVARAWRFKAWPALFARVGADIQRHLVIQLPEPAAAGDRLVLVECDPDTGLTDHRLQLRISFVSPPGLGLAAEVVSIIPELATVTDAPCRPTRGPSSGELKG